MKRIFLLLCLAYLTTGQANASIIDTPHNETNNIVCTDCHKYSLWWQYSPLLSNSQLWETKTNAVCLTCHGDSGPEITEVTHASLAMGTAHRSDLGEWSRACVDCHDPHFQQQLNWSQSVPDTDLYLVTGTITPGSLSVTGSGIPFSPYYSTFTYQDVSIKDGWDNATTPWTAKSGTAGRGLILSLPRFTPDNTYEITEVDEGTSQITVKGRLDNSYGDTSTQFGLIYGQLIRDQIAVNGSMVDVKFFDPKGGFVNIGDNNGICQVCHTQTRHFRNNGIVNVGDYKLNHLPLASVDCIPCHAHPKGFVHGGGASGVTGASCGSATECHGTQKSHPTHLGSMVGIGCDGCHDTANFPWFKSGTDANGDGKYNLAETDVCNTCHSADGAPLAKQYFGTSGHWKADKGEKGYCGSCHDATPGYNGANAAYNIMGDDTTYGFYVTGHGKTDGNYTSMSWQDTTANGNPAANQSCSACHDLTSQHFFPTGKRLKVGFENDQNNANCAQCHYAGGLAQADPQFFTNSTDYENSAHGGKLCTECHDVHGTAGHYIAMTRGDKQGLCYQCHTEGKVMNNALSGGVNDIQEAFSQNEMHNLGTSFENNGKTYSLQCTSCHNVHLITGKYWDAEQGNKTPITRFPPNGESNGKSHLEAWGDKPGEKTDDFAARGSGTGGFYYKSAQGYALGATALPFDQPAKYQPPKKGSGYDFEFGGDVLPDYTTFCLDCHSSRVADNVGAVNWGQGISGGFPDPPGPGYANWVNTSAPHGLSSANMSSYISDSGTAGFWGTSGNPDILFDMNYVTRGRHTGHFMRWPYDSADRSAGINFVMACTDCHEAHGSPVSSMLRSTVNTGPGSSTWNTMCNNCHYYYGGQHAGMSCATASCHEGYSIHRMKKNNLSGSTQLMLTSAGHENDFKRPDFTPEIKTVSGHIGSNEMQVTFRSSQHGTGTPGLFGKSNLTGTLDKNDFWLFDKNANNPRTITDVSHTAGAMTATLTMSAPLQEVDLSMDTLAMKPASAWGWYEGGYVNSDSGAIPAQAVSAGPWPATITGPPSFNIQSVLYGSMQLKLNGIISDSKQIYVTFAEGAYSNNSGGGDLQGEDFVLSCGGRIIDSVTHIAGDKFAFLTLNTIIDQSEVEICTVAATAGSIFDFYGNPADTAPVTLALPPEASVNDLVLRWDFNEGSGTVANSNGASGTQEDMHGVLTRNVQWVASTKPNAAAGDNAIKLDRISDKGAVQLNYTVNPDDGFPPATYRNGGATLIVQEVQQTSEFSFSVWIKPTALGCQEGKDLGLNTKLRREILTTIFWIKNWALGIMRFSDDGDPISGDCTNEDSTHDVLRFWIPVGDPTDMRCDPWSGSWPETVYPVSPAGYSQGTYLQPTDQSICNNSANPTLPTNHRVRSFAQTETLASGAPTYGVALQPGVWQHIVGTWDGRYIRIYIDGQLAAETDMGGIGNYIMLAGPDMWGGDLLGDGSLTRHVSSSFAAGARPIFGGSGSPSVGAVYWNANGFYDLNNYTYVGELDDVKYWKIALPLTTIQN